MASNPPSQPLLPNTASQQSATNIITALGNAFKSQTGDPLPGEHIAQLLIANMSQLGELAKQGKLTQQQIGQVRTIPCWHSATVACRTPYALIRLRHPLLQLKQYADKHKAATAAAAANTVTPQVSRVVLSLHYVTDPPARAYL